MSLTDRLADRFRQGRTAPFPLDPLLASATPVVRLGMWLRLRGPRVRVNARVISIGNLTAGGTGKTPAVIERARQELQAGNKVAVLTRGYKSRLGSEDVIIGSSERPALAWAEIGDEPALIARKLPEIVIAKGANRVRSAQRVIEEHACTTIILDDGYQYVRLERDENVVVIDATNPFGNGHLIPRGVLREPLSALSRATQIVLSRCDQAGELTPIVETIGKHAPNVPIRRTYHQPVSLTRVSDGAHLPLDTLLSESVVSVCAIGNPVAFERTLRSIGTRLNDTMVFPDHAMIPSTVFDRPELVVITEKDAVRLSNCPDNVYALDVELHDYEGGE